MYSVSLKNFENLSDHIGLLSNVLLLTIYLIVKPEQNLMTQFFVVMVICQIFNFDIFNLYICGYLGIFCTALMSVIPLSQIVSSFLKL